MRSLYQIGEDMAMLDAVLDEVDGDLSKLGDAEELFVQWCQELYRDEAKKVDNYHEYVKHVRMHLSAARAELEQWKARVRGLEAREKFLLDRMRRYMETKGVERLEGDRHSVKLCGNGGLVPIDLLDVDLKDIDERFVVMVPSVNMTETRKALEAGEKLPFAKLGERGKHVRLS